MEYTDELLDKAKEANSLFIFTLFKFKVRLAYLQRTDLLFMAVI